MASCKDCVCVNVCELKRKHTCTGTRIYDHENIEKLCLNFKDRSRFVELPSDGVMYGVLNGEPFELPNYISPSKGKELFILSPETVNVPFFKSKEEAEQALKEREENE